MCFKEKVDIQTEKKTKFILSIWFDWIESGFYIWTSTVIFIWLVFEEEGLKKRRVKKMK